MTRPGAEAEQRARDLPVLAGDKAASSPQHCRRTAYAKHSAATARHSLGVLRRVFDYAIRDGAIQRNPAAEIQLPKVQDNDPRPLTHDELWRLAGQFEGTRDRLLVLVAGYCVVMRAEDKPVVAAEPSLAASGVLGSFTRVDPDDAALVLHP